MRHKSLRITFRRTARMMKQYKEVNGLDRVECPIKFKISGVVRVAATEIRSLLYEILNHVRAFSIALYSLANYSTSYLGVRIRLLLNRELHNAHLVSLQSFERHTG